MQQRAASRNSLIYAVRSLFPILEKLPVYYLKQRLLFKIIGCFLLAHLSVYTLQASNEMPSHKIEAACPAVDYNVVSNKQMIILTSDFTTSGGAFAAALDGATANAFWVQRYQDITNKSVMKFQFPNPTILTGIESIGGHFLRGGATYKIQGSNDGSTWEDLTGVQTYSTTGTAPAYGAPSNSFKYPVTGNTTAYVYYQIYGVSYQTWYDWIGEFYFETQPPTSGLTNVSCNDATTLYSTTDDYITFDLNPNTSASGTYSIIASGATVTPSIANFGSSTSFRLQDGSAGSGNVTLTIIDNELGCDLTETLTDPGTCLCPSDSDNDGICDTDDLDDDNDGIPDVVENAICNIDYNVTANKQLIELSATANVSGNIQVLFDGNVGNNNFFYPDVSIVDKEIVRLKFPKSIILTGIEFEIGNSYMFNTGATTRMQASNDGTNWTDVSSDYVMVRPPDNTPGVLSSAPHAQTFLWSNSTPYQYYRLYGIAGNTNQNPWINELHFQIASGICDLDNDGIANHLDLDSDNDGIPDNVEGQATLTYVAPNSDSPAQYLANNGINSAYGTGLVPPNLDGDFCEDFLDIDTDGDGTTDAEESGLTLTGAVGTNGLYSSLESADDYSDANGNINDPKNDLASANPGVVEVFYRKIPAPGGVEMPLSAVNGVNFKFYQNHNGNPENGAVGLPLSTGYAGSLKEIDDVFLGEAGNAFHIDLTSTLEITTTGDYTFQFVGLDDNGAVFINGTLVRLNNDAAIPINLTTGMHQIQVVFSENSGGERCYVQYSGADTGNSFADIPSDKLWITPQMSAWYKANIGVTGTEGTNMTKWEDQSANSNDLSVLIGTPVYYGATSTQLMNYNPVVDFPEAGIVSADHSQGTALGHQSKTVISVFTNATSNGAGWVGAFGRDNTGNSFGLYNSGTSAGVSTHGNSALAANYYTTTNIPELNTAIYNNFYITPTNNASLYGKNKLLTQETKSWRVTLNDNGEYAVGSMVDRGETGNKHSGKIAEFIVYPWALSDAERLKVESYLALKYGITLDTNYVASNDVNVWTKGGGYDNDIAGIGKDILSGLDQKQSKSTSGDFVGIGLGTVETTNVGNTANFADNNRFMLWGHNGAALDFSNPLVNDHKYATRLWKIKETGTVDSVEISLHISDMRGTVPMLVRSTDATIDASDDQVLLTLVGDYYKGKIDFSDGDYFTFAQEPPPAPGGVAFGLGLWILPSSITYDAANDNKISRVEDFSGSIAADQTYGLFDLNNSDAKIIEGGINFNPNIEFDGGDFFRAYGGFNTNTWTAGERFTVLAENETGYNGNNGFVTDFAAVAGGAHYTYGNKSIYHRFGSSDRHSWNSTTGANVESDGTHQGYLFDTRNYLIDNVWSDTNDWGSDINANPTYRDATNTPNFTMSQFHWGAVSGAPYFGYSPEIFFYSRKVTDQERFRINTYLGIKYGITLGSETNLMTYIDSKGDTLWTGNADYQNNIAGIGQDNASGLFQKQATTINTTKSVVMYLGDHKGTGLPATNKLNTQPFPNNRDFMVWGSNGESFNYLTPYTPNSFVPDSPYFTMESIWIIQEKTGNIGTVTIKAPKGATYLLIHNAADFSTGTPTEIALTEDAFGNPLATYDFTDGDYFTFAQEPPPAPGGVSPELGLWLRGDRDVYSDLGTTTANNGEPVQQWTTQFGEDNPTQGNATQQPLYQDGSNVVNAINFNPGVVFDGSNDELNFPSKLGITGTANFTIFAAGKAKTTGGGRIFGALSSGNNAYEMDINPTSAVHSRVVEMARVSNVPAVANEPFIAHTARDGNTFSAGTNGFPAATGTRSSNFSSSQNYDLGSAYNQNPDFNGTLGEFIVYNGVKTGIEFEKIQSYLAIKYGVTLDTNYVASDGNLIWEKDSIYHNHIAGIGYDKRAGLDQKQSWSQVDTTIAIGLSNIYANNPINPSVFDNNLSFLLWGSNGATTTIDTMITPLLSRMKRVWKTANVQNVGDVIARVHGASLGITDETPVIIVSSNEIIDENDTVYSLSESGDYFKGTINLPDGMYFTIGLQAPQPLIIPIKYSKN